MEYSVVYPRINIVLYFNSYVWIIPFDYITENNNNKQKKLISASQGIKLHPSLPPSLPPSLLLLLLQLLITLGMYMFIDTIDWDLSSDGFIKANINQTGFYRVNYDIENWQKIINHLMIPTKDRPPVR